MLNDPAHTRRCRRARSLGLVPGLVFVLLVGGEALADRPYIFGMGHFLSQWANKPLSYDVTAMDKMVDIGATAIWIDFPWAAMEFTQGTYDWSYADFQVEQAEAHGLEMFAFVGTTPDWAKRYPNLPAHRTPPSEAALPAFNAFHTALAARYAGRVKYYQFWNEPSGCGWVNDGCNNASDCSLFTLWQQRARNALKAGNPNCLVSAGGFDGDPASYVQCMYNQGGATAFDAISIHPYASGGSGGPGTSGEGIDYSDLTEVRNVMVANGDAGKKIWITEYGWSTTDESRRSADLLEVLTELKKPEYHYLFYAKYLVLNDGPEFCCFGLTDSQFNPKPAYNTFKNFNKTFVDTVEFAVNLTSGPTPLAVSFYEQSDVAGATSWLWSFGDGHTSTELNPIHTYVQDGVYTVRLTVTGTAGPLTREKVGLIRAGRSTVLVNPSFEDPIGYLNGWNSCLDSGSSIKHNPGTGLPVPRFHDGSNSAGMSAGRTGDSAGEGAIFQEVAVRPGHTYQVGFWAAMTVDTGQHGDDYVQLRLRDGDKSPLNCTNHGAAILQNSVLKATQVSQATSNWTQLQGTITPTGNVLTVIAFWDFNGTVWAINSLHLDDWWMIDVTPRPPADLDGDYDVDMEDFGILQSCTTGPAMGPPSGSCQASDLDGDGDVDLSDFAILQRCLAGPNILPLVNCGN